MKTKNQKIVGWEPHLVRRAQAGEAVAFDLLVDLHRGTLFSLALRMLRNSDDAKDAVQETLLKALRSLKDFDPDRPIRPWLCRICSNCCVDAVRARKRDGEPLDQHEYMLEDPGQSLHDSASERMRGEALEEAISRLPARYRQIIRMRHFKHMDVIEIAHALEKPEGTVKSWLFRARALLKKDLGPALG